MWAAMQIVLVITRNSPGTEKRTGGRVNVFSFINVCGCVYVHMKCVHVVWDPAGSSPPTVGLSQPEGWSQPVSER